MSILKNLVAAVGVAGTLGAAAPAFADWYRPAPPVVVPPAPPVYVTPPAQYGYGYGYCPPGMYCRPGWGRDDWRWRRHRAHEWREHEHREHERREHHRWGW